MKGYTYPKKPIDTALVEGNVLVGCKRCNSMWYEKGLTYKGGSFINGPSYKYDFCDHCKKKSDMV